MITKQPSYYRNLVESVLNETGDWTKYIAYKGEHIGIYAPVNHPIIIGEETVALTRIEVPLNPRWNGMFGAYFMDQDFNHLEHIYDDKNAWTQVENSVGKVLGISGLKLGKGQDFFEPLDGGDEPGIRPVMPVSIINNMIKQFMTAAGKDRVLKMILRAIKDRVDVSDLVASIKQQGGSDWPEMAAIEKSINAEKHLEETGVVESISDKPSVNAEIEKILSGYDNDQQTRILDAMDALKMAGPGGLSPTDWASKVRELYPDGGFSMQDLLKTVVGKFKCCVKRTGDKLYAWDDSEQELRDVPHDVRMAVGSQVRLASIGMDLIKSMSEFTIPQLATKIHAETDLPLAQATEFADHLVQQFHGGMIKPLGDGRFKTIEEPTKTSDDHMDDLRNILKNAGLKPESGD